MTADYEITQWIEKLSRGDDEAAQAVWEQFFDRLVRLATRKLEGLPLRSADGEDVALSAMRSFYRGVTAGRFPHLGDRLNLWKLLATITVHKAAAHCNRERAQKRGGGKVKGESIFLDGAFTNGRHGFEQVIGREPTPELVALMEEEYCLLLDSLEDKTLRSIAVWKMEGHTNAEMAHRLAVTERTVERKLRLIRSEWLGRTHHD